MKTFDFDQGVVGDVPSDLIKKLSAKLEEAVDLKAIIDQLEADVTAAKRQLHSINTTQIPDMMTEMGIDEITQNGWKITIKDFVSGSLPKDPEKKRDALKYLEENEGAELIKTTVNVMFTREERKEALKLYSKLASEHGQFTKMESSVHPQTLASYARERMRNGEQLDAEMLGLFTGRVAKYAKV